MTKPIAVNNKKRNRKQIPPGPKDKDSRKARRLMGGWAVMVLTGCFCITPVLAADDPLSIVNNLSDFVFSCIRAVGIIILGWGMVQVGMSVQSHDASQRTQGFLCLFGGLLITFAKEILGAIGVV